MRRRGMNGNVAVETLNAAATAIASLENRVPQASIRRRGWASCWSPHCCFGGSYKNTKRIGPGVFRPEPSRSPQRPPPIVLPFTAPPSSPASFVPSEPHSSAPSPSGMLSLSANILSPTTGPYAQETQLVSPPGFSTFDTDGSTGPSTPPPESATPSSPEVPFAWLLESATPSSPEVPFARLLESRPYRFARGKNEKINGDTDTSEEAHSDGENWSFLFPMVQTEP